MVLVMMALYSVMRYVGTQKIGNYKMFLCGCVCIVENQIKILQNLCYFFMGVFSRLFRIFNDRCIHKYEQEH